MGHAGRGGCGILKVGLKHWSLKEWTMTRTLSSWQVFMSDWYLLLRVTVLSTCRYGDVKLDINECDT